MTNTNSKAKHTPGPWRVDGVGIRAMVRGDDATIVAIRHRHSGATHEANAHLIAAAPDMLEALERSTMLLRRERAALDENETPYAIETIDAQIARNDVAIKKARGEP